jgi:prepilin peptidase CpaA
MNTEITIYAERAVIPLVIAVLTIAVYTDLRWRLIKNVLTVPTMILGLLLHFLIGGWSGLIFGVLGLAVGFGLMMIPFAFGQMGGGDVKLMTALGSLLGAYAILNVFLYTTLAGGLLALGFAARHKESFNTLRRAGQLAKGLFSFHTDKNRTSEDDKPITMPYGLAIAAGTLIYLTVGKIV